MRTRIPLPSRCLARWRDLDPLSRREWRGTAADWLYALGTLLFTVQFQIQALDGWGLAGAWTDTLLETQSELYGPELPGLLYVAAPALCASAAMLVRRTRPLWLLVLAFLLLLGFGNIVPALVAVYSYAAFARSPLAPVAWSLCFAAVVVVVYQDEAQFVFMGVMAVLLILALGLYVGTRRQLVDGLTERAERLDRERHLLAERAVSAERNRIAREMHDVVAHRVSLIVLHAGGLEVSTSDPRALETAGLIRGTGRQALGELRDILGVLRQQPSGPAPGQPQPTLERVRELLDEWREAGMTVELRDGLPGAGDLPLTVQRAAFQVVKEGVTNAAKHAAGADVTVSVRVDGETLTVEVANAEPPSDLVPPPESGYGLSGLRERVDALGGRLTSEETPDGGWRLTAELPAVADARSAPA
ncbi:sensor histidine kinase [Nocardiopsis sp. L17-MgMaSL7]|uniref:sensor histidine kinase n=1 Tax=Nocardiopsis sp. L17-MgMaSL7 TaxID=1938893 RepID=UPI000D710968|nr:histidine kinase [Nocardiopsis sp. L17-MgMaSL7]